MFSNDIVIIQGSPRFGTLGEATINLASYIVPETCTASLPLIQHGSHGAILQVRLLLFIFSFIGSK